jgi:hypothetical protein
MPKDTRVVFARIGWMKYYKGSRSDDPLIGGGSYNNESTGSEVCNFKPINKELHGYFQPVGRAPKGYFTTNLARITPGATADHLDGVTVIFIATDPTLEGSGRERIIGWYRDATVLRVSKADPTRKREGCHYNVVAEERNACLLPPFRRKHSVPRGKGGMGQANVRYLYDVNGVISTPSWMRRAISYVETYSGQNLLTDALAELTGTEGNTPETAAGFESDSDIREAVEERAMNVVEQFYGNEGFRVERTSGTQCYDFRCTKG